MAQNNRRGRSGRRRQGGNQGNNPNRSIDSQGPEVKIRGNAQQVYDKYTALARDAFSNGDRVRAESLQQHAEHYYRMLQAMKPPEQKNDGRQDGQSGDGQQNNQQNNANQGGHAQQGNDQPAGGKDGPGEHRAAEPGDGQDAEAKPKRRRRVKPDELVDGDAAAVGDHSPSEASADAGAGETSAEDGEAKPRRRRRSRRKTEDEGDVSGGDGDSQPSSEEAPAA